jgi:hypothetical protein
MKYKLGKIAGFILGFAGFLLLFKVIFLSNIPPSDELAPGVVVIIAVISGLVFALVGGLIQGYWGRKH